MIFFDTETCGFHGPIVLIQWSEDDGPIHLHSVWKEPASATIELIEYFVNHESVCGFNLAFDWFHICQMYTTLLELRDKDSDLEDLIEQYAEVEPLARDGPCVKPRAACDVMLHARKGPYQSTMDREDIRIKRVPAVLAWQLAKELERTIPIKDIYFARRKQKSKPKWQIYDCHNYDGSVNEEFKDIVLSFNPSTALKALAADALQLPEDEIFYFDDIELGEYAKPNELGYAPYAKAVGTAKDWKGAWPEKIGYHITHWSYNERARKYANKDVVYTRDLYKFFGSPKPGDVDSELACMVAAVRWKGFAVDIPGLKSLKEETKKRNMIQDANGDWHKVPTAPRDVRRFIEPVMSEMEREIVNESTKKVILEEIAGWKGDCELCESQGCDRCPPHPAAERAAKVLDARKASYEADLYDKFIAAGRFHASFKVIGTLSSRMSGTDDLNPQGIKGEKRVRAMFPLAKSPMVLCAGDFSGFEVTIAEAVYHDEGLRKDLMSGKKIHGLFGQFVFPHLTYEQLLATEKTELDLYTRSKQAVFAMFYGGTEHTLKDRLGVDIEVAISAKQRFHQKYPGVGDEEKRIEKMFGSMRQPGGIGSRVIWNEPEEYIESLFGFRRYFTLENQICKALFNLSSNPPKEWRAMNIKVQRRDRVQTAYGALQSALYGAAFAIQSGIIRAARNHVIQSSGAQITKAVQVAIWGVQPTGIHKWYVQPMNIHDEIECPCLPEVVDQVKQIVNETVETFRPTVPLIKLDWQTNLNSWADKS